VARLFICYDDEGEYEEIRFRHIMDISGSINYGLIMERENVDRYMVAEIRNRTEIFRNKPSGYSEKILMRAKR